MESFKPYQKEKGVSLVEKEANFEGNQTLLMVGRTKNPVIREQLIDMLAKNEECRAQTSRRVIFDKDGNIAYDEKGEILTKAILPKNKEEIEEELRIRVNAVLKETNISFEDKLPHSKVIYLGFNLPSGSFTAKQKGIVEAHEKGHIIRNYESLVGFFDSAFDWSKLIFIEEDYQFIKKYQPYLSYEEFKERLALYMASPEEIAERMSQLKNYFGLKGDEIFTLNHLNYARDNYVKDTGLDNQMTLFFSTITPETEQEFLRLINSSGI